MSEQDSNFDGRLRARLDWIAREVGETTDLQREILSQFATLELEQARNNFNGRLEYARQVCQHRERTLNALVEYGLQTLKWSFLLNAGAIAVAMAYAGSTNGKAAAAAILVKGLWPFALGCERTVTRGNGTAIFR